MSIVITGNPGVGKHSITQEIAKRLKLHVIDINLVAKNSGLFEENGDSNDIDVEKLEGILKEKISEKNVIVGHLAPY
ncbi:MAG: shikimate kinase, partial [Nitrosopumilus sp.]